MKELTNCNCILIEHNGNSYVFDYINYEIQQVMPKQKNIFEYMMKEKKLPNNIELQSELLPIIVKIKNGFFFTEKKVELYARDDEERKGIVSFPVVHSCNLQCKYCFAKAGETYNGECKTFGIDTLEKMYAYLNLLFDRSLTKIRLEFVSGGETLLEQNLLKKLLINIEKLTSKDRVQLEVLVMTNGTLLNKDIIEFLNMNNSRLGVSIDGPAHIHNYQRPYKNGQGTYDTIIDNMRYIMNGGWSNNIWVVSVITSATENLIEVLKHHKSIGVKSMEMRLIRGHDDYGLSIDKSTIVHFKKIYFEFSEYLKKNMDDIIYILNDYDSFGKLLKRVLEREKIIYRCQAGKTKFSFTADGDVYPCDSFVGQKKYLIGNVYDSTYNESVLEFFKKLNVDEIDMCKCCGFRYLCGGDCYYNMLLNKHIEITCEMQKYLCVLAIDLAFFIKNNDNKMYKKLVSFAKLRDFVK